MQECNIIAKFFKITDELRTLPPDAVKYKRENTYGVQAMVQRNAVPSGIHVSSISMEELFVFMVKEGK